MTKYEITYRPPAMANIESGLVVFFVKANTPEEARDKAKKRLQQRIVSIIEATLF